jgi:hypothetical protein
MAISNVSSGLRPGVCTSTTRPQAPFEGQMIYETDTNRVLVWDNAAWVMIADTDQPPGLQLVKTQTIGTAVSSVTVTDAFSANHDNYKVTITGGAGSASTLLGLQLGATTTGYYAGYNRVTYSSGLANLAADNNAAIFSRAGYGTANTLNANFELTQPFATKNTFFYAPFAAHIDTQIAGAGAGFINDSTSYTGFTIIPGAGTLTGGTIRVYGYRQA